MQVITCIINVVRVTDDLVFRALADPTRRDLLDRLHERNGQTLGELCAHIRMARQSATQHLDVLESANLVNTVKSGRHKLHYLNPVPLHDIQERWIDKFETSRLRALGSIKQRAEREEADMAQRMVQTEADKNRPDEQSARPTFVYVTYIRSTAAQVWQALTDPDVTADYWGHSNVSDWQPGSTWEHQRTDGSHVADVVGTVMESNPPTHLVTTWRAPDADAGQPSRVTFDIEAFEDIVRLTVTHEDLADETERDDASRGWSAVVSNLKTLLETGAALPQQPWSMPHR